VAFAVYAAEQQKKRNQRELSSTHLIERGKKKGLILGQTIEALR